MRPPPCSRGVALAGPTVPTSEPTELPAGTTWRWTVSDPAYPASDGWTIRYALAGPAKLDIETTAGATDTERSVTVAAAATAAWNTTTEARAFRWTRYAEKGSGETLERYVVGEGRLLVQPNPSSMPEGGTWNERMLAAIEATLAGRVVADVASYQINGRALNRLDFAELRRARRAYRAEVWRERNPGRSFPGLAVSFWPCR